MTSVFPFWSGGDSTSRQKCHDPLGMLNTLPLDKGLTNKPGQNNCFLNATIQVLWHLDVFRRSFRAVEGHACLGKSCIFCALKVIFTQYQHGEEPALPPEALRTALATYFEAEKRFQLNVMDDAAECFENILNCIHYHLNCTDDEDACSAPHCITHQKLSMTVLEQYTCDCGNSPEPRVYTQLVHYVSAASLISHAPLLTSKCVGLSTSSPVFFGKLLRLVGAASDFRLCSSKDCRLPVHTNRTLLNRPEIISIGLIWDSESAGLDSIKDILALIGTTVRPADVFHNALEFTKETEAYSLVGIVAYYGMHYSSFCFHTRKESWVYLDDSHVREVGKKWSTVVDDCCKAHYQPLLLIYASPKSVPVARETAMTTTFTVPLVSFRSKSTDPFPRSTPIEHRNDEQESKSEVQRNVENKTTVPAPLHQEGLRNAQHTDHSSGPSTEDSSDWQTLFSDAERLVGAAQQLETQGNLDAALDCYSEASDRYDKAMMVSPVGGNSRIDRQLNRDRCVQRSRSLSLKLGIRRQPSKESPSDVPVGPEAINMPAASPFQEQLPPVKEGILIEIEPDTTPETTCSESQLFERQTALWKQSCQEADEFVKEAGRLESTGDFERALDYCATAFATYKRALKLLPQHDWSRDKVQEKSDHCRKQARAVHRCIQNQHRLRHHAKGPHKLERETRSASPATAYQVRGSPPKDGMPVGTQTAGRSEREQCSQCGEFVPWVRKGLCALCRYHHKQQLTEAHASTVHAVASDS